MYKCTFKMFIFLSRIEKNLVIFEIKNVRYLGKVILLSIFFNMYSHKYIMTPGPPR